jgi:hypothetical protein
MVFHFYNSRYVGVRSKQDHGPKLAQDKNHETIRKIPKAKIAGDVVQVIEHLPS